jgi:hypothetical protein
MKKLLFIASIVLLSFNINAQKMSPTFLEGEWTSNGEATEITFKKVDRNKLSILEFSSFSGIELKVLRHSIKKNKLYIDSLFELNNFKAITRFIIIDQDTMLADIVSDYPGQVIYKRILNYKTN